MAGENSNHNPYVGPRTFQERDARHFFGRDREGRELLSLIISEPLVLFYAESGAGKSSLINAKIIPGLREKGFYVHPVARVGGELPEGIKTVDNIYTFNLLASLTQQAKGIKKLANTTLSEYMAAQQNELPDPKRPRALIIDQFEEILTTHPQRWEEREPFFKQLGELVRQDRLLWVVLTMREDYVGSLEPFEGFLPGRLRARYYMQRMEAPAAIEAIEKPAANAKPKRPFAPGVAQQLVDNLRQIRTVQKQITLGQYIEPVQLQVVCYQLWENLKGSDKTEITAEDVKKLGDVDQALADFFETALADVLGQTNVSEQVLRKWFEDELITEASTRGTAYRGDEVTAGMPNEVVAILENKFLLRAEVRPSGTWYELIHDRFIAPIQTSNQEWRLKQSPLLRAAEEWERDKQNPKLLYQDELLEAALASTNRETAEPVVQAFLTASEQAQSQRDLIRVQKEAEEKTRQAEAEAEISRRQAEISSREAEAKTLINRRLRWLAVALAFFVIAAAIAAYFAVLGGQEAAAEAIAAQATRTEAEVKVTQAIVMQSTIEAENMEAIEQRSTAEAAAQLASELSERAAATADAADALAREADQAAAVARATAASAGEAAAVAQREFEKTNATIASQRRSVQGQLLIAQIPELLEQTNNAELALLFGVQAHRFNEALGRTEDDILIYQALRSTLARPVFNTSLFQGSATTSLLTLPAERVIISGLAGGEITVWNQGRPGSLPLIFPSPSEAGEVLALALHPSGGYLASGHQSGQITLWEMTRGAEGDVRELTPIQTLNEHTDGVHALAFNADGSRLASGGDDVILRVWETSDPRGEVSLLLQIAADELESSFNFHSGRIFNVAFRPNGQLISASDNTLIFWNLGQDALSAFYFLAQRAANLPFQNAMTLSTDGNYLAVGVDDSDFLVYWLTDILPRGATTPIAFRNRLARANLTAEALAFQPGGRFLAVYSSDGRLRTYDVSSFEVSDPRAVLGSGRVAVKVLAFMEGPAGRVLVSGGDGRSLRLWQLDYVNPAAGLPEDLGNLPELLDLACTTVERNMTQAEWDDNIEGEAYQETCLNWDPHFTTVGDQP